MWNSVEPKLQFHRDGFIKVQKFLDSGELDRLRCEVDRYQRDVVPGLEPYRALYESDDGRRAIKHLVSMDKDDAFFADFMNRGKAYELAATLLGSPPAPQNVEFFDKAPQIGTPTPSHQDGFYFCISPMEALTIWVALDDCDLENGCLGYVRGSHHHGILDHNASGVVGFSQGLTSCSWNAEDVRMMPVQAGDCIVHHAATIHFAGRNGSGSRHRRSVGVIYYSQRARVDEAARRRYKASLEAQRAAYEAAAVNA